MRRTSILPLALALGFTGCGGSADSSLDGTGPGGPGSGTGATPIINPGGGGTGMGGGSLGDSTGKLTITIRDFKVYSASDPTTNPDFENTPKTDATGAPSTTYLGPWDDLEIVTDTLGSDSKPVYKNATGQTLTTHGKAAFDQWFRDVASTNYPLEYPLTLTQSTDGSYGYDSLLSGVPFSDTSSDKMFFPIDDGGQYQTPFGNQGQAHNYSFTVELRTQFTYKGGEFFSFSGDDDVFVYINKKRVINLGGIHGREQADVQIDTLQLTKGATYPLDFFYAERHVVASNLRVTTTLELVPVDIK